MFLGHFLQKGSDSSCEMEKHWCIINTDIAVSGRWRGLRIRLKRGETPGRGSFRQPCGAYTNS